MSSTSYPTGKFLIRDSTLENDMWSAQRKFDGQFKCKSTFLIQSRKFSR